MKNLPRLVWVNRQRRVKANWPLVRRSIKAMLPRIALETGPRNDPDERELWTGHGEISFIFLDDPAISRVHAQFFNDPTPTDTITFQHGEILIGAETAERAARELGVSIESELILYALHGLLHLRGFEDKTEVGFATMQNLQEKLVVTLRSE